MIYSSQLILQGSQLVTSTTVVTVVDLKAALGGRMVIQIANTVQDKIERIKTAFLF